MMPQDEDDCEELVKVIKIYCGPSCEVSAHPMHTDYFITNVWIEHADTEQWHQEFYFDPDTARHSRSYTEWSRVPQNERYEEWDWIAPPYPVPAWVQKKFDLAYTAFCMAV